MIAEEKINLLSRMRRPLQRDVATTILCSSSSVLWRDRVGGGVTPAVLPHHRTYGSVYGGSCLLTNSVSELGSVDVSPVVTKRPDRPSEFPTPTS
ncbi:MAG TPA: hypothetical protein DIT35_08890 [Rhodospirillaceae bacterium]|nr:hypothetical protein [Rhodospirillaceae bacterium]